MAGPDPRPETSDAGEVRACAPAEAAFEFSRNKSRFGVRPPGPLSPKNRWSKIPLGRLPQNPGQRVREESVSLGSPLGQVIVVAEPSAVEGLSADQDQTKAYPVLCDLAWCEQVLDAEHREWLRLMFGAEWFG